MTKSNNQVSREILHYLKERYPQAVKFVDIVKAIGIDEKAIFKNLFFLEENHLIQLMSSYPAGATYPTIHMVKIRDKGLALVDDAAQMDVLFPLKGFSSRLDLYRINTMSLAELARALTKMSEAGEIDLKGKEAEILAKLKALAAEPAAAGLTLGKIFEHC